MIEGLSLDVIYTPGHTDDSYSYLMGDRVFTGDTLLIRGTGRTDFQNGSARAQYDSIFNRLLKLPDDTMVFPAHDYKGDTVSTIGEEKRFNPRLQVRSVDEYIELMGNLKLPNPKLMDVVLPANMHVGLHQDDLAKQGLSLTAREAIESLGRPDILLVDCMRPTLRSAKACSPAACCARSQRPPGDASCSSAHSASAPRWQSPPRRMRALPTPPTSPAASTPGRKPAGPCRRDDDQSSSLRTQGPILRDISWGKERLISSPQSH
jgi:hypothetical protein